MNIKVYSEIGKLKKVLVHRPGKEVERLYPEILERLLFDDIMHLEMAQKEHDMFTDKLREEGVEVFYIEKLVAEAIAGNPEARKNLIKDFVEESGLTNKLIKEKSFEFFNNIKDDYEMVKALIAGIKKNELKIDHTKSLELMVSEKEAYPFYIDPIPNILFQRDPSSSIFDGMNIHSMNRVTRRRESIFFRYLFKYHNDWKNVESLLKHDDEGSVEGGDILVINKETIFIGLSERTNYKSVELLASRAFKKYSHLKRVVAIDIPKTHGTMHLDTILTQMDHDKFSVDADMYNEKYHVFEITSKDDKLVIKQNVERITSTVERVLGKKIQFIVVGNGDTIDAKREQWNDGANCLALEPGKIFVYNRNTVTNALIEKAGVKLIKINSGELSRGRGGPRCMSMPLEREEI